MVVRTGVYAVNTDPVQDLTREEQSQLDDALAALLASTRRSKRSLDLIEVSKKLGTALRLLGNLHAVAQALGLSDETVRQFNRIEKLSPDVKKLLAGGRITSMDLADRISRFPIPDQPPIAVGVVSGKLDAQDVRAILGLRKVSPKASIQQLIERIKRSRNIKEYVAEFITPRSSPSSTVLRRRLSPVFAPNDIRDVEIGDVVSRLVLTATGKKALETAARKQGMTKRALLQRLVNGEVEQRGDR